MGTGRSKGGGSIRAKRGQIPSSFNGAIPDFALAAYNKKALNLIMSETGMSREEAQEFQNTVIEYFGGDYSLFGAGKNPEGTRIIDEGLSKMPIYNGTYYRGIEGVVSKDVDYFANLNAGDVIKMRNVSSWTSDSSVAEQFANAGSMWEDSVILTCTKNKSAVGVQHISKFGAAEAEVLAPSTARWKVSGKSITNQYEFQKRILTRELKSRQKEGWATAGVEASLAQLEKLKDRYQSHRVVKITVTEE